MSGPQEDALSDAQSQNVGRADVAKGAALTAAARLGALIEVIAQPAYTWMFGLTGYGVYVVLWGMVNILANLLDLSMGQALQRIVPANRDKEEQHGAVRFALLLATGLGIMVAAPISIWSHWFAGFVAASPEDAARLPAIISIFAWSLPLWIFVETATAAARAQRAFGPEIRLRIFWEQVARLLFATAFYLAGWGLMGLLVGHLLSLAVTALLAWRLLARYYDLGLLLRAPMPAALRQNIVMTGCAMLPPSMAKRAFNDLPPILLNMMLPGSAGASAAGLFGIARKIASIPMIIRQSFFYVLAPLASAQATLDRSKISPLYSFSTHISILLAVPLAGFLILIAPDMLSAFAPGSLAATGVVTILLAARAAEAIFGPATPIIEMVGKRRLPLFNSIIGLLLWMGLGLWLVPLYGADGMAIAVSVAIVATALLAVIQLYQSDRLTPFSHGFLRAMVAAMLMLAALWFAGYLIAPLGQRVRAISLFLLFWPSLWATLKWGMVAEDKAALGKFAKRLRL